MKLPLPKTSSFSVGPVLLFYYFSSPPRPPSPSTKPFWIFLFLRIRKYEFEKLELEGKRTIELRLDDCGGLIGGSELGDGF